MSPPILLRSPFSLLYSAIVGIVFFRLQSVVLNRYERFCPTVVALSLLGIPLLVLSVGSCALCFSTLRFFSFPRKNTNEHGLDRSTAVSVVVSLGCEHNESIRWEVNQLLFFVIRWPCLLAVGRFMGNHLAGYLSWLP